MNPLFKEHLDRAELLALPRVAPDQSLTVAVHRNHSFELVASVLPPFLDLSRLAAEFSYSSYDDSLSFHALPAADLHIIWLDAARYSQSGFEAWLLSRIRVLRETAMENGRPCKVIAACCGVKEPEAPSLPDTLFLDCDRITAPLGSGAMDSRLMPFSGTRLSNQSCLLLARELGTRQIPALFRPPLKAVVTDLDNTLYAGVLAEDGPEALVPHTALQECLVGLGRRGFLLALASKNEEEDVRRLFDLRPDFPLRWEDFAARAVGWRPKPEGLQAIAGDLRIGADTLLFMDDNPGERLQVSAALPEVRVLPADGPEDMLAGLRHYPGLDRRAVSFEDTVRTADTRANSERERLRGELSAADYFRELGMVLDLAVNPEKNGPRVYELLHKTNQFVLALLRPSQSGLAAYFSRPGRCVVSAAMRDRLSDSGLIAAGLFSSERNALCLDELVISCRALGRGVEDGMIRAMVRLAGEYLDAGPELAVAYAAGPRNRPALAWLEGLAGRPLTGRGAVILPALPPETLSGVAVNSQW